MLPEILRQQNPKESGLAYVALRQASTNHRPHFEEVRPYMRPSAQEDILLPPRSSKASLASNHPFQILPNSFHGTPMLHVFLLNQAELSGLSNALKLEPYREKSLTTLLLAQKSYHGHF